MKKITVEVKVKLLIHADETADIEDVLCNMDYNFTDKTGEADIVDTEITDWDFKDSR